MLKDNEVDTKIERSGILRHDRLYTAKNQEQAVLRISAYWLHVFFISKYFQNNVQYHKAKTSALPL